MRAIRVIACTLAKFRLGRAAIFGEDDRVLRERSMRLLSSVCLLPLLAACPGSNENVPCTQDTDCDLSTGGKCIAADSGRQWCAYPDPACQSGLRFSDQGVGDDVGGTCTAGGTTVTKYTLTINKGGSGEGGVTADLAGLTCTGNTCTGVYDEGSVVQLDATATQGTFLGWSDACTGKGTCSVTMSTDRTVGVLFGTPGRVMWATQIGSSLRDSGAAIAVDGNDDVITVGEFSGQITLGSYTLDSSGGTDIYVAKIASATGTVVWAKRFGGSANDAPTDVVVDAANNVYVSGRFLGTVDFGSGPATSGSGYSAFMLRLASDGSYGWARTIVGSVAATAIAVRGNAVVGTGTFNGSITVDTKTLTASGTDIFVMSMSTANGATSWVEKYGGAGSDISRDIAIDSSDNIVITGEFSGTANFGGGALSTPGGLADVLLLKVAGSNGAHLLSQNYGGSAHDYGYGVSIDGSNNIFLTGDFGTTASFGCSNTLSASQTNQTDVFLVKFTQAGSCVWAKGFGGTGTFSRQGRGVAANATGDVAITGTFCGSMTFGGDTLTAAGACSAQDVYAARFASDGTHLNSVRVGGVGNEYGAGVAQSANGNFYISGQFSGFAEFGGNAFNSAGDVDAFIVALEAL